MSTPPQTLREIASQRTLAMTQDCLEQEATR